MTDQKKSDPAAWVPPVLTKDQVREYLRQGQEGRREVDARLERMERVDPKNAAARAR